MSGWEVLETRPDDPVGRRHRRVVVGLVLALAGVGLAVWSTGSPPPPAVPVCRDLGTASWCTAASSELTDPTLAGLVHDYCPRLRGLALGEVVPQPIRLVGLSRRADDLALVTRGSEGPVENVLLGQPGRLAWVVRRTDGGRPWALQVVCHDDSDRAPTLQLDDAQLRSSLRAVAGAHSLDLRQAGRAVARSLGTGGPGVRFSLGTVRCRTDRPALDLVPASLVRCRLPLISDQGQAVHRVTYRVAARAPYLRPEVSPVRP